MTGVRGGVRADGLAGDEAATALASDPRGSDVGMMVLALALALVLALVLVLAVVMTPATW